MSSFNLDNPTGFTLMLTTLSTDSLCDVTRDLDMETLANIFTMCEGNQIFLTKIGHVYNINKVNWKELFDTLDEIQDANERLVEYSNWQDYEMDMEDENLHWWE